MAGPRRPWGRWIARPVQSEGSTEAVQLASAIREALDTFSSGYLLFESPDRMRVGTQRVVRLTTRQNLTDLIRQQLQTRAGLLAAGVLWLWWRARQYSALSHR